MENIGVTGQTLRFQIDTLVFWQSALRSFDAAGAQLVISEGDTDDPFLEFIFATAGTYYLDVSGLGNINYDPIDGSGVTGDPLQTGLYALSIDEI